jgi:hypothetical protein
MQRTNIPTQKNYLKINKEEILENSEFDLTETSNISSRIIKIRIKNKNNISTETENKEKEDKTKYSPKKRKDVQVPTILDKVPNTTISNLKLKNINNNLKSAMTDNNKQLHNSYSKSNLNTNKFLSPVKSNDEKPIQNKIRSNTSIYLDEYNDIYQDLISIFPVENVDKLYEVFENQTKNRKNDVIFLKKKLNKQYKLKLIDFLILFNFSSSNLSQHRSSNSRTKIISSSKYDLRLDQSESFTI